MAKRADHGVLKKHRIIGIRHALKNLKSKGLINKNILYPADAAEELIDTISSKATKWYRIGAKRGAKEIIRGILNGDIQVKKNTHGEIEIKTALEKLTWRCSLLVRTGNTRTRVKKRQYSLDLDDII